VPCCCAWTLPLLIERIQIPNVYTRSQQFSKRSRGIVLSRKGLKRLQVAIVPAEMKENYGNRFTIEELSDRMRVSTRTVSRLWSLTAGLDQRTLRLCFSAFDLELIAEDYTTLGSCASSHPHAIAQLPNLKLVYLRYYKYPT
jgi:hypothetical protein